VSKNKDIVVALREIAAGNVVVISKTDGTPPEESDHLLPEGKGTDGLLSSEEDQEATKG
jgi:hypothetical protein